MDVVAGFLAEPGDHEKFADVAQDWLDALPEALFAVVDCVLHPGWQVPPLFGFAFEFFHSVEV